jgi:branched-subunit amino acid transport protein
MNLWLVMLLGGLLTYATRLSFILLMEKLRVPGWLRRSLTYVPPAVLTAIIFPEIFVQQGEINISLLNPRLIAGFLAVMVAWRTRNALLTVTAGMLCLWIVQAILFKFTG